MSLTLAEVQIDLAYPCRECRVTLLLEHVQTDMHGICDGKHTVGWKNYKLIPQKSTFSSTMSDHVSAHIKEEPVLGVQL